MLSTADDFGKNYKNSEKNTDIRKMYTLQAAEQRNLCFYC